MKCWETFSGIFALESNQLKQLEIKNMSNKVRYQTFLLFFRKISNKCSGIPLFIDSNTLYSYWLLVFAVYLKVVAVPKGMSASRDPMLYRTKRKKRP